MLRAGLFVNFSGILITAVISSASYSSDPFPRPGDSFHNEPDFLRGNRDNRDHNDSSTLAPFQNNLSSPPSSTSPAPQPPSPPPVPQRRIQSQK